MAHILNLGVSMMQAHERKHDIQPISQGQLTLYLNDKAVAAAVGETVLSVLNAVGLRQVARNDHGQLTGSYCGMGVCHCCLVGIDGKPKRRACQTLVRDGMRIETQVSRVSREQQP